jgi:hypothetical protein
VEEDAPDHTDEEQSPTHRQWAAPGERDERPRTDDRREVPALRLVPEGELGRLLDLLLDGVEVEADELEARGALGRGLAELGGGGLDVGDAALEDAGHPLAAAELRTPVPRVREFLGRGELGGEVEQLVEVVPGGQVVGGQVADAHRRNPQTRAGHTRFADVVASTGRPERARAGRRSSMPRMKLPS